MMAHVFLSYARADKQWVDYLHNALVAEKGFRVWIDQNIFASVPWSNEIRAGIKDCAAVIVVLSSNVSSSSYVVNEVANAVQLSKPIIPVLIEPCTLPAALVNLNSLHWVNFTQSSFPQALDSLDRTLKWLGVSPTTPAPPPAPKPPALREAIIGNWDVQMRSRNVNFQLTLSVAPAPAQQFVGCVSIPAPMLPEIKPYSGCARKANRG